MSSEATTDHDRKTGLAPALERGVRILDYVTNSKTFVSLTEIAKDLDLAKSSAHVLCGTLVRLELLIRRPDQTFQLGPHVMRWSNQFMQQSDVATEFASIWDRETELPGATITLSVLEEGEVVYLAARNSAASEALIDFRAGMRMPAPFTATGKAFLSHMSEFEVRRLFAGGLPAARTPSSVASIDDLLVELKECRLNGYSIDNQQVAEGVVCFGACVLGSRNRPIAGVAVSVLIEGLTDATRALLVANVQRIARQLSHRMGANLSRA